MVKAPARSRPIGVTMTGWLVFLLALINMWRAVGLARQSEVLLALAPSLDPRIRMSIAVLWVLLLLGSVWLLSRRLAIVRYLLPLLLLIYGLYHLGLVALFYESEAARRGWPLNALAHLVVAGYVTWALNRPATRSYFRTNQAGWPGPA
jgi:hypothetical protein